MRIEYLPLLVNSICLLWYLSDPFKGHPLQSGKILYWLGGVILTIGLLKMKG